MSQCKDCRFWKRNSQGHLGECRCMPPAIPDDQGRRWPETHESEGCGQFQARPELLWPVAASPLVTP